MVSDKKGNHRGNSEAVREELGRELRHLRALVREVGESFVLRREGEIETLISYLDAVPPSVLRAEAAAWAGELHGLSLKPAKGRLKDLKSIDELIEDLAERITRAQEGRKSTGRGR